MARSLEDPPPKILLTCGKSPVTGPRTYTMGVSWRLLPKDQRRMGEYIYLRKFELHFTLPQVWISKL